MKKRVLVADGDPVMRELLRRKLENNATIVDTIRSLREAKERSHAAYAVIISDYHLPDGGGDSVISVLRSAFPKAGLIIMSGGMLGTEQLFAEQGVRAFFSKPLDLEKLRATVGRILAG